MMYTEVDGDNGERARRAERQLDGSGADISLSREGSREQLLGMNE